jgi:hypothetical protein
MRVYIEKSVLTQIGAAIRNRGGSTEHFYPVDMPQAISDIPHDVECFRQETRVMGYDTLPVINAGNLEHRFIVPALTVAASAP